MADDLFRKAAIDKVSSPEQLDLLMRVTSPLGWLALLTVGLLICAAMIWSVLGSITESVDAKGTLFRGERRYDVRATLGGRIDALNVQPGDVVAVGQTIARLKQEEASAEQREAAAQNLKATRERIAALPEEIANANTEVARLRREVETLKRTREEQRQMVRQGTMPGSALDELDRRIGSVSADADRLAARIPTLVAEGSQLQAQLKSTEAAVSSTTEVKSVESGHVLNVIKSTGDRVARDERLLLIERDGNADQPCGGDVHALIYLPASLAAKVKQGQPVRVSPVGIDKEEYGYIVGVVESIARGPASTQDMNEKLKNDQLVAQFLPSGEVAYEARVCLKRSANNRMNTFEWSFAQGPAMSEWDRPLCAASIEVDRRKPYTYVIPKIRGMLGG